MIDDRLSRTESAVDMMAATTPPNSSSMAAK